MRAGSMTPAPPWITMAMGRVSQRAACGRRQPASTKSGHRTAGSFGRDISSSQLSSQRLHARARVGGASPDTSRPNLKVKPASPQRIRSLLVANRGEIAIRVMRAASELGLRTVAVYSQEDRFSLHRTKADESYLVGRDKGPVEAYLDIADILRIAREAAVDAIHPGYGFLSENPEFARGCAEAGIVFIGPKPATMGLLGNKVSARALAVSAGVAVMAASTALPRELEECVPLARAIGYPVMLKASWGGGGRGM